MQDGVFEIGRIERILDGYLGGMVLQPRVRRLDDRGEDEFSHTRTDRRVDHRDAHRRFVRRESRSEMKDAVDALQCDVEAVAISKVADRNLSGAK
ncbi:hypothetical protein D3C87_1737270 [compost metagenome]